MLNVSAPQNTSYEQVPAGNHVARIYSLVHIGSVLEDTPYGAKNNNKLRLTWELPNETREFDGVSKPMVISRSFNISFHEKSTLRKFVKGLLGKDVESFDLESLVGMPCMLNVSEVTRGDKKYSNVDSAAPVPKGMDVPDQVNPSFILNYTDSWSEEAFEKQPDFIKNLMTQSDEYKRMRHTQGKKNGSDELEPGDIPF